ncbi:MAG: PAS domain S-box protein, partial [Polyangiales bacterium]
MPKSPHFHAMLALAGAVYLSWWFAVEWLLPGSFNPFFGRLMVVSYFAIAYLLGRVSPAIARQSETLYYAGAAILTCHYFYLFAHNAADPNWAVGTYIVVFALFVGISSRAWLYAFAALNLGSASVVVALEPALWRNIFLPGLATIVALCLLMLLSRIRLLEDLSESTARFHSLYDASFEGVAVQDGGKIIDVNASFVAMFGYPRDELIGRSVLELNAPGHRERVAAQIREVPTARYESVGVRKDGTRFAIEISTKPHVYGGRMLRLAAVRDMSDRQRAEEERLALIHEQAARASALEAVRLRDEFISIASHELRTPITSMLLNLDVVARRANREGEVDLVTKDKRVRRH